MAQYSDPNILFQSRPADVGGSLIAGLQARQQYDMNKQAMGENARLEGERKLQLLATGAANIMAAGGDPAAQSQAFDRFRAIVGRVTGHDVSGLTMADVAPIVDRVKMVADQQGITLNGLNIEKGKLELQGARDQLQRQQDYYGGGGGGAAVSPGGLGGLAAQPSAPSVALDDARSVVASAFPNARITSWKRDANDPLTKRNPRSWHANSGGAVDVAPIPGVTFEQYVQKFRDQGYPIIEALNETGAGRSPWATGDHWHVVLGRPESAQGGPVAPVGAGGGVGAPGPANGAPAPAQSVVEAAANDPQIQRIQTAMRRAQAAGATQDANYYQSLLEARLKELGAAVPTPLSPDKMPGADALAGKGKRYRPDGSLENIPGWVDPESEAGKYVAPPGPWNEVANPTQFMADPKASDRFYNAQAASWTKRAEENATAAAQAAENARLADEFMGANANLGTGGAFRWMPGSQSVYGALDSDMSNMQRINAQLTPGMRQPGSGATSDFDARMFQQSTLSVENPREVNESVAAGIKGRAQLVKDRAAFEEWYYTNAGHIVGAEQAWQKYLEANPIFDPNSPDAPRLNQGRQGWREFFNARYSKRAEPKPSGAGRGILASPGDDDATDLLRKYGIQ